MIAAVVAVVAVLEFEERTVESGGGGALRRVIAGEVDGEEPVDGTGVVDVVDAVAVDVDVDVDAALKVLINPASFGGTA